MKSKIEYILQNFKEWFCLLLAILSILISAIFSTQDTYKNYFLFCLLVIAVSAIICLIISVVTANTKYAYIKKQIEAAKKAESSIYIVMNSLSPESVHRLYKKYDAILQEAKYERGVSDIRILAPCIYTEKRLTGAFDIVKRGLTIRFTDKLNERDLRYMLVDEKTIVFGNQKKETIEPSRSCVEIDGKRLPTMLKDDFMQLWEDAITLKEYASRCADYYTQKEL